VSDTFFGKVHYLVRGARVESVAYLDNSPLSDGSYVGINKHTDMPVHLRWSDEQQTWIEVCCRTFEYEGPLLETFTEVGNRPDCICKEERP
jgi:hypothetical protein